MPNRIGWLLCAFALVSSGCGGGAQGGDRPTLPVSGSQREVALPAVAALQRGDFDDAERLAREQVAADDANPYPRLVRAIAAYHRSTRQLALDGHTLVASGIEAGTLNQKYLRTTFGDAERELALPVDQALYRTWEGVVGDARRIVRGDDGVHVGDLMLLAGERVHTPPRGYLDVGRMFAHPKDIVLDTRDLARLSKSQDVEAAMKAILGEYYVQEMHPSPLPRRLVRMKGEIDRNEEEMGRKIRYLLWLN